MTVTVMVQGGNGAEVRRDVGVGKQFAGLDERGTARARVTRVEEIGTKAVRAWSIGVGAKKRQYLPISGRAAQSSAEQSRGQRQSRAA